MNPNIDMQLQQLEDLKFFGGDKHDDRIDALKYTGTVTGRFSGGPAIDNLPKSRKLTRDDELLNPLNQPTRYEATKQRAEALKRYVWLCKRLAIARFEDRTKNATNLGAMVTRYMDKYQFTEEELNGSST